MKDRDSPTQQLLEDLQERAKELHCLYRVDEVLSHQESSDQDVLRELLQVIPPGLKYPEVCHVVLVLHDETWPAAATVDTAWILAADIRVSGEKVGTITVFYAEERPMAHEGPFLREERRLIHAIAERIGFFVMQRRLRSDHASWKSAVEGLSARNPRPWKVLLEFLRRTDVNLLQRITKKMINHLCWIGVDGAQPLLNESLQEFGTAEAGASDDNRPIEKRRRRDTGGLTQLTFELAARSLSETEVVTRIQSWINEEKSTFLIKSLENPGTGLAELASAVERYRHAHIDETDLPVAVRTSLKVALIRRFFLDQLEFINLAKEYVEIGDCYDLVQHMIFSSRSQGKLGGKGAGLFLAAQVLRKTQERSSLLANLRVPKTWYLASDAVLDFIQYNDLSEVYNHKYLEIERVRQDYPHIVQLFKNSRFPPEITKGLGAALDDFEERPIIVRSSSLLEDRVGAAFSGKYKSLFLANQGSKKQRLEALQDAIAEVYASIFGPDPIGYRAERGLLDFREEMGILIQEVVGRRIGQYFCPAYSGVAFSHNEFRWSPRIRREDGLARLVPGLGTRAVDRLSDDYPVLFAPGQPSLRVNVSPEEIIRYSPKKIDVLNLERNTFETIEIERLLREHGDAYPLARDLVSVVEEDRVRRPMGLEPDWERGDFIVTFEGLLGKPDFVTRMQDLIGVLRDRLRTPVDIEFASDGEHLYLVQCRSQSRSGQDAPEPIPRNLPRDRILFSARRYISNGRVPEITHVVYVDPDRYASLPTVEELRSVGRAVGSLNRILPRRRFALIGPGRWGSRGDIRLGVSVTYSDINNTAVLCEVAKRTGGYLPELSFGTHFFQDLVEAGIRYIPLYPDDPDVIFDELFLRRSENVLPAILPQFAHLEETLRVIDIPRQTEGRVLRILLNADLDEGVGILQQPSAGTGPKPLGESRARGELGGSDEVRPDDHWRWRLDMAERLASALDPTRFGVEGLYLLGSTKNATAGPASDLDLIVHFAGTPEQEAMLSAWLEGWSLSLSQSNYLRTGYRTDGLLDVHYVTDQDIQRRTSFAAKIGAVTDPARPLVCGKPRAE